MIGDYQYLFTYRNSPLFIRSNPNATPLVVKGLQRQGISLIIAAGMVSSDPQVDQIEVWRTLGNGAVFFLDKALTNAAQTYSDVIADYIGLHGTSAVLQTEVLPFDNVQPSADFTDVAGLHYGRLFWLDPVHGRVFYSP